MSYTTYNSLLSLISNSRLIRPNTLDRLIEALSITENSIIIKHYLYKIRIVCYIYRLKKINPKRANTILSKYRSTTALKIDLY